MICPHCHSTIREEQRYLMSRDAGANVISGKLMVVAISILAFVFALGLFELIH